MTWSQLNLPNCKERYCSDVQNMQFYVESNTALTFQYIWLADLGVGLPVSRVCLEQWEVFVSSAIPGDSNKSYCGDHPYECYNRWQDDFTLSWASLRASGSMDNPHKNQKVVWFDVSQVANANMKGSSWVRRHNITIVSYCLYYFMSEILSQDSTRLQQQPVLWNAYRDIGFCYDITSYYMFSHNLCMYSWILRQRAYASTQHGWENFGWK